jgi:hypothetical protein
MSKFAALDEGQIRKSLAFAYASPVVGLTVAFITGAAINDLFGTLETWTWFAIQALVGASVVLGAHFAGIAVAGSEASARKNASKGASRLNLVLAIIWFYFVGIQSFAYGGNAISALVDYSAQRPVLKAPDSEFWLNGMLPAQAFILLTLVGVYYFVTLRSKGSKS